jgi:hypothetical protein
MGVICQIHTLALLHPGRGSCVQFELEFYDFQSRSGDFGGEKILLSLQGINQDWSNSIP